MSIQYATMVSIGSLGECECYWWAVHRPYLRAGSQTVPQMVHIEWTQLFATCFSRLLPPNSLSPRLASPCFASPCLTLIFSCICFHDANTYIVAIIPLVVQRTFVQLVLFSSALSIILTFFMTIYNTYKVSFILCIHTNNRRLRLFKR